MKVCCICGIVRCHYDVSNLWIINDSSTLDFEEANFEDTGAECWLAFDTVGKAVMGVRFDLVLTTYIKINIEESQS